MIRIVFTLLSFLLLCMGSYRLFFWLNDDFKESLLVEVTPKVKEHSPTEFFLSEPLHYIGKGSQCFIFESHDKKCILKLARNRYRIAPFLIPDGLPDYQKVIWNKRKEIKEMKKRALFESFEIAKNELSKEANLIFYEPNDPVTVIDQLGLSHKIDLKKHLFLFQKRGLSLDEYLDAALAKNDLESAKKVIGELFSLLSMRMKRGITDPDCTLIGKNSGVLDGSPFFLDCGTFAKDPAILDERKQTHELERIINRFSSSLDSKSQELASFIRSFSHHRDAS